MASFNVGFDQSVLYRTRAPRRAASRPDGPQYIKPPTHVGTDPCREALAPAAEKNREFLMGQSFYCEPMSFVHSLAGDRHEFFRKGTLGLSHVVPMGRLLLLQVFPYIDGQAPGYCATAPSS